MTEQNLTRGILLQKNLKPVNTVIEFFKIGKIIFTNQYSYFIPTLETSHYFFSIIYIEPEKKHALTSVSLIKSHIHNFFVGSN